MWLHLQKHLPNRICPDKYIAPSAEAGGVFLFVGNPVCHVQDADTHYHINDDETEHHDHVERLILDEQPRGYNKTCECQQEKGGAVDFVLDVSSHQTAKADPNGQDAKEHDGRGFACEPYPCNIGKENQQACHDEIDACFFCKKFFHKNDHLYFFFRYTGIEPSMQTLLYHIIEVPAFSFSF